MFRRSFGYSQKKVARILSLSDTSTLSRWEHGVILPSTIQTFRLCHLYHTEPQALFDELWDKCNVETNLLAQGTKPDYSDQSFIL